MGNIQLCVISCVWLAGQTSYMANITSIFSNKFVIPAMIIGTMDMCWGSSRWASWYYFSTFIESRKMTAVVPTALNSFSVGMHLDVYDTIWFKLGLIIDTVEHHILMLIWLTLTFIQGHISARNFRKQKTSVWMISQSFLLIWWNLVCCGDLLNLILILSSLISMQGRRESYVTLLKYLMLACIGHLQIRSKQATAVMFKICTFCLRVSERRLGTGLMLTHDSHSKVYILVMVFDPFDHTRLCNDWSQSCSSGWLSGWLCS